MISTLLPAILDRPTGVRFGEQEADEHIELFLRQHWVTNLPWVIITLLLFIFPVFLPGLLKSLELKFIIVPPSQTQIFILALATIWYMLILSYIVQRALYWYFNVYIVTNKHLIDIKLSSLLAHSVTESQINDLQSVSSEVRGLLGGFFYFGDVIMETAAKKQTISFYSVPDPNFVADRIQDLQEAYEEGQGSGDA